MNTIEYDPLLVALSYVISVFGSYTALQLAIAIPQARTWAAVIGSVTGASVALGGGAIWSMHFIGMNAADMGVPVAYDPLLTFVSLILALVAPAIGLFIVGRGGCGMPCTAMGAVRMEHTKEALPATGISLSPSDMAYSVFAITAVLLAFLLIYGAWKAHRTLRVDI